MQDTREMRAIGDIVEDDGDEDMIMVLASIGVSSSIESTQREI